MQLQEKTFYFVHRHTYVEQSRGELDWLKIKEIFVRSFMKYPLYKYLVPNEDNRQEFLRRYLEATYDVAVRHGNSILLSVNVYEKSHNKEAEVSDYVRLIQHFLFLTFSLSCRKC